MAERKTGPVKPPTIDLTAKPAVAPASAAKPANPAPSETAPAPEPETNSPARASAPAPGPHPDTAPTPAETAKPGTPTSAPARAPNGANTPREPQNPASASTGATRKPEAPKSSDTARPGDVAPRPRIWPVAVLGIVGGAIIGVALSYALAYSGYWPQQGGSTGTTARLDQMAQRLASDEKATATNTAGLKTFDARIKTLEGNLNDKLTASANTLESLKTGMAALKTPSGTGVENSALTPLQDQVKALSTRLDALDKSASQTTPAADTDALAKSITTLDTKVSSLAARTETDQKALTDLKTGLAAVQTGLAKAEQSPSAATITAALQMPLILSGLESALANGQPFASALARLARVAPDIKVPAAVSAAAKTGLPAPATVADDFAARVPAMLAARPGTGPGLENAVLDWARGILAIRPQGTVPGTTPDAVMSRLDAAIKRHDFADAHELFAKLPPPMREAADRVPKEVAALADADAFVAHLRATALTPLPTGAPAATGGTK